VDTAVGRFRYRVEPTLPPLAWLARLSASADAVEVVCGTSVRWTEEGFFEGTWAGEGDLVALSHATTVFGSGIVLDPDGQPLVVTPAHTMSGVFSLATPDGSVLSNSFTGLLTATGAELLRDGAYPPRFIPILDGFGNSPIELPSTLGTISFHFWWNLRPGPGGELVPQRKPEEKPFTSFADYRARISAALRSALRNAGDYEPVVALSSGYDSTAVAVLASESGCRHALTFAKGRYTIKSSLDLNDSGAPNARRLGWQVDEFDRLSYLARDDQPEAEFLATGMSGEDVIFSAFEPKLGHRTLLTGNLGNGIWKLRGSLRTDMRRGAYDGASLHEFRLRRDFLFVPIPVFGHTRRPSVMAISESAEMQPWVVGGRYDQPIARRIAEEAGLPRGSFAYRKHAAAALLHAEGLAGLSPATVEAVRRFAAESGEELAYPERFRIRKWHRAALKLAPKVRADGLVSGIEARRRALVHFEPQVGTLLLRWGVSVIQPRYRAMKPD
jgi:hypothetical protein